MKLACAILSEKQFNKVHEGLVEYSFAFRKREKNNFPKWQWEMFAQKWENGFDVWAKEFANSMNMANLKKRLDRCLGKDSLDVFEFAGKGSQRAAFVDKIGNCIKVGFMNGSEAQFAREAEILKKLKRKDCFPKLMSFSKHCMWCETAMVSNAQTWKEMFGVSCKTAVELLNCMAIEEAIGKEHLYGGDSIGNAKKFAWNVLVGKNPKWKAMKQMYEAIAEDNSLALDIDHADNWGIVERDKHKVMVCIDVGI